MSGTNSSPVSFRKVLLTGGSGFVGSWLTPALRQLLPQAALHVLTRHGEPFSQPGWKTIEATLADPKAIAKASLVYLTRYLRAETALICHRREERLVVVAAAGPDRVREDHNL